MNAVELFLNEGISKVVQYKSEKHSPFAFSQRLYGLRIAVHRIGSGFSFHCCRLF